MINYTDIILEAYEDNHIDYVELFNSKEKLSIKKDQIEVMYIDWFMNKAQIIERDFFIQPETFIENCLKRVILMMQVLKDNKSRKEEFIQFGFMFTALGGMKQVMNEPDPGKTFADYLNFDDKERLIEKIRNADRSKPKKIYFILKALFDNGILLFSDNETIYKAYYDKFGYTQSYDTLKKGLNYYRWEAPDRKNSQKIRKMYDYLIS